MLTMLTSWAIELRTLHARLQIALLVGSLLTPVQSVWTNINDKQTQHHPWMWCLGKPGARKRAYDSGGHVN